MWEQRQKGRGNAKTKRTHSEHKENTLSEAKARQRRGKASQERGKASQLRGKREAKASHKSWLKARASHKFWLEERDWPLARIAAPSKSSALLPPTPLVTACMQRLPPFFRAPHLSFLCQMRERERERPKRTLSECVPTPDTQDSLRTNEIMFPFACSP